LSISSLVRPVPKSIAWDAPWLLGCVTRELNRFKPFVAVMLFLNQKIKDAGVHEIDLRLEDTLFMVW